MRRRLATGVLAQGVASLSNIAMSLCVARILGAVELGRFSLVYSTLILATAIQTAWVGDGLAVLGPKSEATARWWQHVLTTAGTVLTTALLALTGRFKPIELGLYAALCVCWLYEEFGRRWLMANQRFGAQGVNDVIYLVASFGALVAWLAAGKVHLSTVLACMAFGGAVAVLAAQLVIPHPSRVWRRPGGEPDLGRFRRYGVWRSAAAATGALSTVATRTIIAGGLGLRELGNLEMGRSLAGPAMTVLAGLGNVLLPVASANAREQRHSHFPRLTWVVTVGIAMYGVLAVGATPTLVHLLGGSSFRVSRITVGGWFLVAVAVAVTQSVSVRSLVHLPSRNVFLLRAVGTVLTVALVAIASFSGFAEAVPFAFAAGTFVQGGFLKIALRTASKGQAPGLLASRASSQSEVQPSTGAAVPPAL